MSNNMQNSSIPEHEARNEGCLGAYAADCRVFNLCLDYS